VIYQELGIPYHPPDFESYYAQFTSVLPLCSEVAALSPRLLEHCREKLKNLKELSILPIMSDEISNGSREHAPSSDRITFGFAARMEEIKGPMVLLEAFARAQQLCGNLSLNIAGDGSQRQKIAARAKSLNIASRYRYHGVYTHPKERRAFMDSLDVFVMPSFSEGTPNSIVEAMACGKPIIATDVGGVGDMIGDDAGFLVPCGESETLAKIMIRMAGDRDLREEMGRRAKERYLKLFAPSVVVPLLLDSYHRVSAIQNGNGDLNGHHPWATYSSRNFNSVPVAEMPAARSSSE